MQSSPHLAPFALRADTVRMVGRRGAITIARKARGEVVVTLEGHRVDELLPRAAAELALDLGRLAHLVVDASRADEDTHGLCSRWADAHRDRASRVTFTTMHAPSGIEEMPRAVVSTRPPPVLQLRHA